MQVEVEGQWLPVCKDAVDVTDKVTQNTICGQMNCGEAIKLLDHFGPQPTNTLVISKLQWTLNDTGDKVSKVTKIYGGCALAGIQCSGETPFQMEQFDF